MMKFSGLTHCLQRVAKVLWGQLDTEQRELHVPSVELFYRLHCLAPFASICEDIICQELAHKDKVRSPGHTMHQRYSNLAHKPSSTAGLFSSPLLRILNLI